VDQRVGRPPDTSQAVDGQYGRPPWQGAMTIVVNSNKDDDNGSHTLSSRERLNLHHHGHVTKLLIYVRVSVLQFNQVNKAASDAREEEEVLLASLGNGSAERYGDVLVGTPANMMK
jgi:hypothetical protein